MQEKLRKELEKETEQNQGDLEHLEQLKEHYEKREKAYAVCLSDPWCLFSLVDDNYRKFKLPLRPPPKILPL